MTEPHPLRCETCNKFPCEDLLKASETMNNKSLSISIRELFKGFVGRVGCASHSNNTSAEKVLDELENLSKQAYIHGINEDGTDAGRAANPKLPSIIRKRITELRQERERP